MKCHQRRPIMWLFFLGMTWSAYTSVVALFLQVPIFISVLPEKEKIASTVGLILQVSSFLSLSYMLLQRCQPKDSVVVFIVLTLLTLVCGAYALFWSSTVDVAGVHRSLPLYIISIFAGLGSGLSNLVLWPFVAKYEPQFSYPATLGMGLCSVFPSILVMAQGSPAKPRFSVEVFFIVCGALTFVSWLSFLIIYFSGDMYKRTSIKTTPRKESHWQPHRRYSYMDGSASRESLL
eukprot:Colp12_sorted_trinity150504_noHs@27733